VGGSYQANFADDKKTTIAIRAKTRLLTYLELLNTAVDYYLAVIVYSISISRKLLLFIFAIYIYFLLLAILVPLIKHRSVKREGLGVGVENVILILDLGSSLLNIKFNKTIEKVEEARVS
jgi:hypothetical protein